MNNAAQTAPTYRVEVYLRGRGRNDWFLDGGSRWLDLPAAEKRADYCNRGEWPGDTRIVCEETGDVVRVFREGE